MIMGKALATDWDKDSCNISRMQLSRSNNGEVWIRIDKIFSKYTLGI